MPRDGETADTFFDATGFDFLDFNLRFIFAESWLMLCPALVVSSSLPRPEQELSAAGAAGRAARR